MRKLLLLTALFICCFKFGYAQPGSIDASFGNKGTVQTDLGTPVNHNGSAKQVLLQTDGSMYVIFENTSKEWRYKSRSLIAKKHPDGSLDSTYGHNGFSVSVAINNAHAALQKDGKIVIAGVFEARDSYESSDYDNEDVSGYNSYRNYDFGLARFNTDGSLDHTFNEDGKVTTDFTGHYDAITSIAIQSDGKIMVGGFTPTFDDIIFDTDGNPVLKITYNIALARYDVNGSLDKTFDGDGKLETKLPINNFSTSIAIQIDGKIVVAGSGDKGLNLARYNSNGSADNTFKVTETLKRSDGSYFAAKSLALQKDGKIVLGGLWQSGNSNNDFVLVRFNINGSLDNTFDKDGIATTDFRTYNDIINAITIQSDGKIVAAGYASNGRNNAFAIARYNTNGSLDNTFDSDGKKMTYITSNDVFAVSVAVQSNGKLVAAGYEQSTTGTYIALIRYNTNGSLDNTFAGDGTLIDHFAQKNTVFTKIAIQKDGKTAAVGYYWNGTTNTYFVARYIADGTLDNTFSSDGIQTTDFALSDIKIQTDGKIVATGSVSNGNNSDFRIVRYNTNGSLDNTFSGDGKLTTDFGFNENANSLAIQSDGKIVIAGSSNSNFALARYNTNGSLDNTFSGDGKQTTRFADYDGDVSSSANSVAIHSDGKIVLAGNATSNYYPAFAIACYKSDGSLDNTFSQDGMQTTDASEFNIDIDAGSLIVATSVKIQSNGKIIVGGYGGDYSARDFLSSDLLIARYNTDGSFDNTFSEDGRQAIFSYSNNASIALQDNGKILVQGNLIDYVAYGYRNYDEVQLGFAIARLNTDGNPDPTFGTNGVVYSQQDQVALIQDIAIADNKLYAAGYGQDISNFGVLSRYLLTAPFVKITSPANNTVYATPATITVRAVASDEDGTVSSVKFYNGSTYLKTVFTSPYTYTISNLAAGTYTLTAKATDNAGLQSVSQPVTVTVLPTASNKAPVVSITSPSNNTFYTAPATITINASATDPDGTISKVQFYKGGTLLKTDSTSPYTCTINNLASGNYSFTAKATDNKGLASSSSSVSVGVSVTPNKAPVVNITNPVNNVIYNAGATINITAAAKDADGSIGSIYFYNGGTFLGGIASIYNIDKYTLTLTDAAPGTYSFVAKATDNQGLRSSSATVTVQVLAVTNKPPTVSITSPANNATYTAPANITIKASASDADGTISSVKFYNGATYLKTVFTSPYAYTLSNLPAGNYSLTAKATDNNGAQTISAAVTISVKASNAIVSNKPASVTNQTDIREAINLSLAPNPARDIVNIYLKGLQQNKQATLSVISVSGVVMKTMRLNNSNQTVQLDVSSLVKGVYTIKVIYGDKVMYKQFVKL